MYISHRQPSARNLPRPNAQRKCAIYVLLLIKVKCISWVKISGIINKINESDVVLLYRDVVFLFDFSLWEKNENSNFPVFIPKKIKVNYLFTKVSLLNWIK